MFKEKDFVVQQIKGIAKTLGKFMGLEQIKEIIDIDEDQSEAMSDDELETILAAAKIENILNQSDITVKDAAEEMELDIDRLREFLKDDAVASDEELEKLTDFIQSNQEFL